MMEMPIRAGRRIQDIGVAWNETQDRISGQKQQRADIRRRRMTCSESLRSFQQTQDWTGSMGMSPSGRFQVVEQPTDRVPVISRTGIRWQAAWALLIIVAALLAFILLGNLGKMGLSLKNIDKLSVRVEALEERCAALQSQLDYSSGDVSVCTEAVKLNLIASNGARTIQLTAPRNATLTFTLADPGGAREIPADRLASIVGD